MTEVPNQTAVPKPGLLRWEIGFALIIKVLLLTGLWFLIFRWPEKPVARPDIAEHLALPPVVSNAPTAHLTSQPQEESRHVR